MADRQTWPQFNWNDLEASLRSLSLALYGSLDRSWHGLSTHKAEALACINQSSSQSGRQAGKQACQDLKKQAYTLRKPKEKKQSRAFSCLNWRGRKDDMDMDLMAGWLDGWMYWQQQKTAAAAALEMTMTTRQQASKQAEKQGTRRPSVRKRSDDLPTATACFSTTGITHIYQTSTCDGCC